MSQSDTTSSVREIDQCLFEYIPTCRVSSRSEVHLFLINIHTLFGDRYDLDDISRETLEYLSGIMHDINGKQNVSDLEFFRDLSNTLEDSHEDSDFNILNTYVFDQIFFLQFPAFDPCMKQRSTQNRLLSLPDSFSDLTIDSLVAMNATYSSHAIERFYQGPKWRQMGSITMNSRLALCYRWHDPLNYVQDYNTYHLSRTEPKLPLESGWGHIHTNKLSISEQLSSLLSAFALPLKNHVDKVYLWLSDDTQHVIKNAHDHGDEYDFTTTSEIPVCKDKRRRVHGLWLLDPPLDPSEGVKMKTWNSYMDDDSPHATEIDSSVVWNRNVCIRIQDWLVCGVSDYEKGRDFNLKWMIPGLLVGCSYWNNKFIRARFRDHKLMFTPMGVIGRCDNGLDQTRHTIDNLIQQISARISL